ncbi:copper resistance CopC family protein [Micromonospora sp. GCM10011542]|uniref:copper resistance CopC family protein n=1 Tax=Micromonospora sp. GCM10011542 TaxID=3317337 RepID=UPI00362016CC
MARAVPVLFGVAFGVSLLFPAAPAAAHNSLTGSDPANGARVATAPTRIELRFLAKPDPGTTRITVTGPDNVAAAGGAPTFTGSRVSVPFRPGRAGLYIVGYQVASGDGHPVTGEVRFTLTTGTAADPSATPSAGGGTGPGAGTSAGSPSAGSLPAGSPSAATAPAGPTSAAPGAPGTSPTPVARERADSADRWWLWTLGGLVLLAALVTGLLLRRRSTSG